MNRHALVGLVVAAALGLGGCATPLEPAAEASDDVVAAVEPAEVDGAPATVTLSEVAARRLGIATDVVRETTVDGLPRTVIPYSAVVYSPDGGTWAFTTTGPLSFVRVPLTVDAVQGEQAVLSEGPPAGTVVVTVGVAELLGTETGVGGE